MQVCPQCQSDRLVNNGSAAGKPKNSKVTGEKPLARGPRRKTPEKEALLCILDAANIPKRTGA